MKRIAIIALMVIAAGLAITSCNTHQRCPAYGNSSAAAECAPVDDVL